MIARAGLIDARGDVRHAQMEPLESRVMLTGFNPGGLGIGLDTLNASRPLAPADVSTFDINGTGAGSYDRVSIDTGGSLALSGILKLRFGSITLNAGDTFTLFNRTAGTGTITGAFLAIDGLAGVGGAGLNLVALQSPQRLLVIATTLPTADATIVVKADSDLAGLISFFSTGAGSPSANGGVYAFGQHFDGSLAFGGNASAVTIGVTDGSSNPGRITIASASGGNVYSAFGAPSFTLKPRSAATNPGLRLNSGFAATGYALGESTVPVGVGISGRLGAFSFSNVTPTLTNFVLNGQSITIGASIAADSLSLAFPGSGTTNPGGATAGATTVVVDFGVGLQLSGTMIVHPSGVSKFMISAASFDAEVPGIIKAHAETVTLGYDPDADRTQTLLSLESMTVEMPKLGLTGTIAGSMANPGLVVRGDGFQFGTFSIGPTNTDDFFQVLSSPLWIKNWQFTVTDFGMTFPEGGGLPTLSTPYSIGFSVAGFEVRGLASGVTASGTDIAATVVLGAGSLPTGYSLTAAELDLEVPNVLHASATGVGLTYSPGQARTEPLFFTETMTIDVPRLHLRGSVTPSAGDPGLTIRGDGFLFGNLTVTLDTSTFGGPSDTSDGYLGLGQFLSIKNPSITLTGFGVTVPTAGPAVWTLTSVTMAAEGIRIGKPVGSFRVLGTGLSATVTLNAGAPQIAFAAESITVDLPHVHVSGTSIAFDPQGVSGYLLRVDGTLSASVALPGAASISGSIGHFQINSAGVFEALPDFGVSVSISGLPSLTNVLGGVKFPSFLVPSAGTFSADVKVNWPAFADHPERFMVDLTAAFNVSFGANLTVAVDVQHLIIDTGKLFQAQPKNPFVSWTSFGGSISGQIAGTTINVQLVVGIVKFDLSGNPYPSTSIVTDPDLISDSIMYFGASANITLMNKSVALYFGISERGFLQAYVRADVPIPLGNTSLVLTGFRGGVTFNATQLPDISDPVDLRAPIFQPPGRLSFDEWKDSLRQLVINQKGGHGGVFFEVSGAGQTWGDTLDEESDPGVYFPTGLRNAFLNNSVVLTHAPGQSELIALTPGSLWLLKDVSGEYLIEKSGNTFSVSGVKFSLDGGFVDAFPDMAGGSTTADMISYVDGDGATHTLIEAFDEMRIPLSATATVTKAMTGDEWEIVDGDIKYQLTLKGTGPQVLTVMGGESPLGASNAGIIRIDAGFSLTSTGADQAWRVDADAIVTIGATVTDTRIVLLGSLSVGPESAPTLQVDAKLYLNLAHAMDTMTPPRVDMFLLIDFIRPPSAAEMSSHDGPVRPYLSIYGHVILTLPTTQTGELGIRLEGSSSEGLAVFDTGGLTQGAFADQKLRLGGLGAQTAYMELTFSSSKLEFSYYVNLSAEGIINASSLGQSAGHFVIDFSNVDLTGDGVGDIILPVDIYGAAKISVTTHEISAFETAGISGDLAATLKINTSGSVKSVTLDRTYDNTLGTTEIINLKAYSLAIFAGATLTFEPKINNTVVASKRIAGFFSLEVTPNELELLIMGTAPLEIPVGPLAVPVQADILGVLVLKRYDPMGTPFDPTDDVYKFAARLEIGIESRTGEFIHFNLDLRMFMNTTSTDITVSLPQDFMARFNPTASQTSLFNRLTFNPVTQTVEAVIPRGAPTLTFNPSTYNSATPGNQIDAAGPYIAIIGIGNFTLGNEADFGFALAMNGNVRIKFGYDTGANAATFSLGINASVTIGPLGALTANGNMTVVAGVGAGGAPFFNTWGSFQLAGSITIGQLSLVAAVSIDVNTSSTTQLVPHYYNTTTHAIIPANGTPDMVSMPQGIRIFAGGGLSWSGTQLVAGEFTFATTSDGLSMTFNAVLNLQPIAGVAVTGALNLYNTGDAVGFVTVAAGFSAIGFRFDGQAYLKINTLDTAQPLALPTGTQSIDPNSFEIYVSGDLRLTTFGESNLLSLHGDFWLKDTTDKLTVRATATLGLGDFFGGGPLISMGISGFASIYKTGQHVLVMDVGVTVAGLGIPHLLEIGVTNAHLRLNTSSTPGDVRDGIARGFHIGGTLGLKVVGLTLASVSASIDYEPDAAYAAANGAWHISANLNVDFFGIVTLHGQVDIYSRGAFYFSLSGGVNFGNDWFGASFTAGMTFDFRAQNDGDGTQLTSSDLNITGTFSGEAHAGIKVWGHFIGVSLGAGGTFNYNGATHQMTVYVYADFGSIIGRVGGTFSLGTLDFMSPPPPPRLAGPGIDAAWSPSTGGTLYLNVGTFAPYRNVNEGDTVEQFTVEAITPLVGGRQKIRVSGFGLVQEYDNVSGIVANFDTDSDYFFAGRDGARGVNGATALALPITVNGGGGNDTIIVLTTGSVSINGNAGGDYIEVSGSGGTVNGNEDDDTITWLAGNESGVTLDGGGGVNAVQVMLTTGADRVQVDPSASSFLVKRLSAGGTAFDTVTSSNFMVLTLTGLQGADTMHVGDLTAVGVKKVIVDASQFETGTITSVPVFDVNGVVVGHQDTRDVANDTDADAIILDGQSTANTMNIVTGADTQDLDGDGNTTESMLAVLLPSDTDAAIIRFKIFNTTRSAGDTLTVNGGALADVINASGVAQDLAALIINGGDGGDTLTGSPFADTINGGAGANVLYGGSGNDTITAGNGANFVYGDAGNDGITTGTGNDTIDGGDGNDTINSGLGDDTITGGLGTDIYIDAGGHDTLIETRTGTFRAFTITDNTFIVGTVTAGSPIDFSDRYSVADETENLANIFEVAIITGGAGANRFAVGDVDGSVLINGVPRAVAQRWSGTITLDGVAGGDSYFITVFGDSGAVVNVSDTGAAASGVDRMYVFGADDAVAPDTFLIRANFIASVKDTNADLVSDTVDRINFTGLERSAPSVNDAITISGLAGDDRFISDDNSVPMTLSGGDGKDYFQFGQLFGVLRNPPYVAAGDDIATTAVDLTPSGSATHITGYLSNGTSQPTTVSGGEGGDTFLVNRTMGLLFLRGDAGNDIFTIRAFALDGTTTVNQATTAVSGGADDDSIEYAADAPIDIDGGEGIDAIRILGTQFGDRFRITDTGISLLAASGTSISVAFVGVESLELHAGDGNDTVYVVSTSASFRTAIFGGAGGDHIYFGLDPLNPSAPKTLSSIAGPVLVEGGVGDPTVFGLSTPIMLPTETNIALPPGAGSMSDHELPTDVDIVDIDATQETRDLTGSMAQRLWPLGSTTTATVVTLSGLSMGGDLVQDTQTVPGGISFRHLEVIDARLGSGNETIGVSAVSPDAITLLTGNGGADIFNVSAPDAPGAMFVIYGDARPGESLIGAPGDDRIDARTAGLAATVDAGPGADVVLGGSGDDRFAGGAGDDVIAGGAGDDVIIGDSRFTVDRLTRTTTITTSGLADSDQTGHDTINPGDGFNIVFGDHGLVAQDFHAAGTFEQFGTFTSALTVRPTIGASDVISARSSASTQFAGYPALAAGQDLIFGGAGGDTIDSGEGADWVIGDHASAAIGYGAPQIGADDPVVGPGGLTLPTTHVYGPTLNARLRNAGNEGTPSGPAQVTINSTDALNGAGDQIDSGGGDDVVVGGVGSDTIDAGAGNDVVFGDHGRYDPAAAVAQQFTSTFFNQSAAGAADHILAGEGNDIVMGQQGADVIFGGGGDDDLIGGHNVAGGLDVADVIDGGAGNDVILGDNGTIVRTVGARSPRMVTPTGAVVPGQTIASAYDASLDPSVSSPASNGAGAAWVRTVLMLDASPTTTLSLFGGDQIAGGAGDDVILAGNGDDVVRGDGRVVDGPVPALAASVDPTTDGADYIEGNSGNDAITGDLGQDDLVGGGSSLFGLTAADRADGSDTIFGGNGTQTLPGSVGDTSATGAARDADVIAGDNADILRLVAADGTPLTYNYDAGAAQRIAPRVVRLLDYTADGLPSGDTGAADTIHGEAGADTIYGMTGNDTLYGDGQNDDLIGGSGDDWIYGGTGNDGVLGDDGRVLTARGGVAEPLFGLAASTQQVATTGDQVFTQTVFTTGSIIKYARLQAPSAGGNDVIYGGLGDDSLHGGGGMDAISGAEALAAFASPPATRPTLVFNIGLRRFSAYNPGFALLKIQNFFLNFDGGPIGNPIDDGTDAIFGGDGNDWLVGGTNSDRMFGGMGDDVLNGDDQLDTGNGQNNAADFAPNASPDIMFGGGGLDRMIGSATHDRLIDWNGEFNQYVTPFTAAYPTITKNIYSSLVTSLQLLGAGNGSDTRLAEPNGELGIVQSTDAQWLDQFGRP